MYVLACARKEDLFSVVSLMASGQPIYDVVWDVLVPSLEGTPYEEELARLKADCGPLIEAEEKSDDQDQDSGGAEVDSSAEGSGGESGDGSVPDDEEEGS
jgi:hypothetical protein